MHLVVFYRGRLVEIHCKPNTRELRAHLVIAWHDLLFCFSWFCSVLKVSWPKTNTYSSASTFLGYQIVRLVLFGVCSQLHTYSHTTQKCPIMRSNWIRHTCLIIYQTVLKVSLDCCRYVCHAEVNAILNKNHATATGQVSSISYLHTTA